MTPAQKLTKAIRDVLAIHGWYSFKCAAGMIRTGKRMVVFGTVGAPDLVAVKGEHYLLIEVKAGKDELKPSQIAFRAGVEAVGGRYYVVKTVDDVLDILRGNQ